MHWSSLFPPLRRTPEPVQMLLDQLHTQHQVLSSTLPPECKEISFVLQNLQMVDTNTGINGVGVPYTA